MSLGSRVLVATDLQPEGEEAIRQGHRRAVAACGELVVCHVVRDRLPESPLFPQDVDDRIAQLVDVQREVIEAVERQVIAATGQRPGARESAIPLRVVVEAGTPDTVIVRLAEAIGATLVVVGCPHASGVLRALHGSVAMRVTRHAHVPVLITRSTPAHRSTRVLCATDLSEPGIPAIAAGVEEARSAGAKLTLLHAVDVLPGPSKGSAPVGACWVPLPAELVDDLRRGAEKALRAALECADGGRSIAAETRVARGDAATAILETSREMGADLVVLATRGRTGLTRMALGSVAEEVASRAACSVLAVRAG
jgi:nucleotide-binding universal stress UspA family protein